MQILKPIKNNWDGYAFLHHLLLLFHSKCGDIPELSSHIYAVRRYFRVSCGNANRAQQSSTQNVVGIFEGGKSKEEQVIKDNVLS